MVHSKKYIHKADCKPPQIDRSERIEFGIIIGYVFSRDSIILDGRLVWLPKDATVWENSFWFKEAPALPPQRGLRKVP